MRVEKYSLSPPSLEELGESLLPYLRQNYETATASVVTCPDLREKPYDLAVQSLAGEGKIADVGGELNLFPAPHFDTKWSMLDIAKAMEMQPESGSLFGAGAGPFHVIGRNCELAPNFSWTDDFSSTKNRTRYAEIEPGTEDTVNCKISPSLDCALMMNLFGSEDKPGPVLRVTAKIRKGDEGSFTECIQKSLLAIYGESRTVSLGGVVLVKSGKTMYHVMPDFPPANELPFKDLDQLTEWLTFHEFESPMVNLSVLHSVDPGKKMGLRMEHSHGFSPDNERQAGHYHYDLQDPESILEYEGYFNTAQTIYRIDRPSGM